MEILAGIHQLSPAEGAESYLVTVCRELERLGHEVTVFTAEPGGPPDGVRVATAERGLPLAPDVIYAQDAYAALLLADLYPLTPQAFVLQEGTDDLWLPPQLPGVIAVVIACDDRVAARARAASLAQKLVRLRQPVDVEEHSPRGPLADPPRRVHLSSGGLSDHRRGVLERACAAAGLETVDATADADIVVGRGRAAVEAMAAGRAVYVYGDDGGDGWVSPDRYELLEADGFTGRAEPTATDFDWLRYDLDAYSPDLGPAARELAVANHDAADHAHELVAIFEGLAPRRDPVEAPLRELARLVRVQAAVDRRAEMFSAEAHASRARVQELEGELDEARARGDELASRVEELEIALQEAREREAAALAQRSRGVRGLLNREEKIPSTEG